MTYCIYDKNDECTHDCEECARQSLRCEICGSDYGQLFDCAEGILCTDCLIEKCGDEAYEDFAAEYESEFRDFMVSIYSNYRVENREGASFYPQEQ